MTEQQHWIHSPFASDYPDTKEIKEKPWDGVWRNRTVHVFFGNRFVETITADVWWGSDEEYPHMTKFGGENYACRKLWERNYAINLDRSVFPQ